ncbi:enoyl-CoA hydratase/isomerase family protein [Terricaulis sp.]|uniref:enoyl-CoA hydratase/isomerase family protein n=1 Tax=Terricaulis sp. TaxID=2768686 RepID=UPI003784073D
MSDGVALIVIDSPPVNALSHRVRIAIHDGVTRAMAEGAVKAVVLACVGRTFFAGADVTELNRPIEPPLLADIMAAFEQSSKPVIAALHGTALGGGFELALACHYRVAVRSAKVGLPEVALGLLPGAGGTQRVPRLIGVAAAVDAIGLGRTIGATEAMKLGLIDAVIDGDDPIAGGLAFARGALERAAPLQRVRDLAVDLSLEQARAVFSDFRAAHPHLFVGLKAADGVLRAIEAAVTLPFDEGLLQERAISRELTASPESAAQRRLFFAERAAAKAPGGAKANDETVVRLVGAAAEVAEWSGRLEPAGARLASSAGDLVIEVSEPARVTGATLGFMRTGALVEITYASGASPQALADAMALVRRLGLAGVFVAVGEGLIVERLCARARATADALIAAGASAEALASIAPGLLAASASGGADGKPAFELLDAVAAEAALLVQEGAVERASDIDFAMTRAGRWPIWLGGPIFWAERQGLANVAARLHKRGATVPALLQELADAERGFDA